ncbi:toll/interleukin-1 receptor domain-containing protein [Nitrosomonas sp.]|uniref:toll/interleukin-1 receptor domain-containing protein n=1 Tax=Nitrosomonas sp. TaxID=42353 RepID=UPI0025FD8838|nr:toll/interleukin-1 receptor domain-containing protein [Nitrosomonas sp.]
MIVILYQNNCEQIAKESESKLRTAFVDHVKIVLIPAILATSWPVEVSWDDLLVVLYEGNDFPAAGNLFIGEYIHQRQGAAMLLPVAVDPSFSKPPEGAAAIKSLPYGLDARGTNDKLVNRVGGMLGLRLQGRDSKIFISYRATDGLAIAKQLYNHLKELGHQPWLDEAKELDAETKILPGTPVQDEIDKALSHANLVLLLDTPSANSSTWIKHEVDTADAMLLPILPICFREAGDSKIGPRFQSLLALQRWVSIQMPTAVASPPLEDSQLDNIVHEVETYLCEIFRRKCRVPFIVRDQFVSNGFGWEELDKRRLMFKSTKTGKRLLTKVLSHCSIFDQVYAPSITLFRKFLNQAGHSNYSLFIYDGDLLSNVQLNELVTQDDSVIILHHQELKALMGSNFTVLGTT